MKYLGIKRRRDFRVKRAQFIAVLVTITMGVFLFRVDALVLAVGFGLALLIGLFGAWVPSRRALRLRMVDAMRYT